MVTLIQQLCTSENAASVQFSLYFTSRWGSLLRPGWKLEWQSSLCSVFTVRRVQCWRSFILIRFSDRISRGYNKIYRLYILSIVMFKHLVMLSRNILCFNTLICISTEWVESYPDLSCISNCALSTLHYTYWEVTLSSPPKYPPAFVLTP